MAEPTKASPQERRNTHKNARTDLSAERCRELFDYEPDTGVFRRKTTMAANALAGSIAGQVIKTGKGFKIRVSADGGRYLVHRLAWLWMTGEWPLFEVDHIDTDGTNNRWNNLRHATSSQNLHNRGANLNNTTGLKGAHFVKKTGRYIAHIKINGKNTHLGVFDTAKEAHESYKQAAIIFHGEFARWE